MQMTTNGMTSPSSISGETHMSISKRIMHGVTISSNWDASLVERASSKHQGKNQKADHSTWSIRVMDHHLTRATHLRQIWPDLGQTVSAHTSRARAPVSAKQMVSWFKQTSDHMTNNHSNCRMSRRQPSRTKILHHMDTWQLFGLLTLSLASCMNHPMKTKSHQLMILVLF